MASETEKCPDIEENIKKGLVISGEYGTKVVQINNKMYGNAIVKYGKKVRLTEAETIKFVSKNTSIPVPKVFDAYNENEKGYIIMEYIEGQSLEKLWKNLTNTQKSEIVLELEDYIKQLRSISQKSGNTFIGAVNGDGCIDNRRYAQEGGPFKTEAEFNNFILSRISTKVKPPFISIIKRIFRSDHKIVFTHGDLAPRNIMVKSISSSGQNEQRLKIVAIIDWEFSGWYPEYWEYVKSLSAPDWDTDWIDYLPKMMDIYDYEYIIDCTLDGLMIR